MNQGPIEDAVHERVVNDIFERGYCVVDGLVPSELVRRLQNLAQLTPEQQFKHAGVGRSESFVRDAGVRSDKVKWISENDAVERAWSEWTSHLMTMLNRRLMLGLFSFESHFAQYQAGDFYQKHRDAFRGESNRRLSLVLYLNSDWSPADGGELVLYDESDTCELRRVLPKFGTLVLFLSEDFPHEVLPSQRTRWSIAGWFRVNSSGNGQVDPPR